MRRTGFGFGILAAVFLAACDAPLPESGSVQLAEPTSDASSITSGNGGFLSKVLATREKEPAKASAKPKAKIAKPLEQVVLAGGDVIVAGPSGYCIDPVSVDARKGRSFAVMASCHILSAGAVATPAAPVLVTVTVGPTRTNPAFPNSAALARGANAKALTAIDGDALSLVQLDRGGASVLEKGDPRYWRGSFLVGTRQVGMALYAPKGASLVGQDGADFLRVVARRTLALSPEKEKPQLLGLAKESTPEKTEDGENAGLSGLVGRLFKNNN